MSLKIKDGWILRNVRWTPKLVLDCICWEQPGASPLPPPGNSSGSLAIAQWNPKKKKFWCLDCGAVAPEDVTKIALLFAVYKRDNEPTN